MIGKMTRCAPLAGKGSFPLTCYLQRRLAGSVTTSDAGAPVITAHAGHTH